MQNTSLRLLAPAMLAALMPQAAQAQDGGISYDCDTAPDHVSQLVLPTGAPRFSVTGKLKLMNVATSKEYAPMTRLSVSQASDQPEPSQEGWAGFELLAAPGKGKQPPISFLQLSSRAAGSAVKNDLIGRPSGNEVSFALTFDGSSVAVEVDGQHRTLPFTASGPVVRIACSTGEFLYSQLVIAQR